jgi:hypothetical protein
VLNGVTTVVVLGCDYPCKECCTSFQFSTLIKSWAVSFSFSFNPCLFQYPFYLPISFHTLPQEFGITLPSLLPSSLFFLHFGIPLHSGIQNSNFKTQTQIKKQKAV